MIKEDQNAFFDRVTTSAALVEKSFGERLHLASAYAVYQLPASIKVEDIRVTKDNMDSKWKISAVVDENGRTDKKTISLDNGFSLFQARTVTREQLAVKYLSEDIEMLSGQKQTISNGLEMQPWGISITSIDNINSKKMAYSFEELVQLKQDRRVGWLRFVLEGERADDFMQWCKEHNIHPSEDTAGFYMESIEPSMQDKQTLVEDDYDYSWN